MSLAMDSQISRHDKERLLVGVDICQAVQHIPCLTRAERCRVSYLYKKGDRKAASVELLDILERLNAWDAFQRVLGQIEVNNSNNAEDISKETNDVLPQHSQVTKIYNTYNINLSAQTVDGLNIGTTTKFSEDTGLTAVQNEQDHEGAVEIVIEGQDETSSELVADSTFDFLPHKSGPVTSPRTFSTDENCDTEMCSDHEGDIDDNYASSYASWITTDLVPTKYQEKLASPAISRHNSLILLPHQQDSIPVATLIIKGHLGDKRPTDTFRSNRSRVLFLVPNNRGLHKAYKEFKSYLYPQWCVAVKSKGTLNANDIIANDVIVATAETLEDSSFDFSGVTLLILDGCLHAIKKHTYNTFLTKYLHDTSTDQEIKRSQVVGLCANLRPIGTANVLSLQQQILELCAVLTAEKLVTIDRDTEILDPSAKTPTRHFKISSGYEQKDCTTTILDMMIELEKWIHINDDPAFGTGLRGTRAYGDLLEELKALHICHPVYAGYIDCLQACNEALLLLKLISAEAAIAKLVDFIERLKQRSSLSDMLLVSSVFSDRLARLQCCSRFDLEKTSTCNGLEKLKDKLLEQRDYCEETGKHFSALAFFENTDHAHAIKQWIEMDSVLCNFRPELLTDKLTATESKSVPLMDNSVILANYHRGRHQILCCTTPWQNLDVDFCSMMVLFDQGMKEITLVMSRDDTDSQITFTTGTLTSTEGHEINVLTEEKLSAAIEKIQMMPPDIFLASINEKQFRNARHCSIEENPQARFDESVA